MVLSTGIAENIDPWLVAALLVLAVFVAGVVAIFLLRRSPFQTAGLATLLLGCSCRGLMVYALTALPGRSFYVPRWPLLLPAAGLHFLCAPGLGSRGSWGGAPSRGHRSGRGCTVRGAGRLARTHARPRDRSVCLARGHAASARAPAGQGAALPGRGLAAFCGSLPRLVGEGAGGMDLAPENVPASYASRESVGRVVGREHA